MPHAIRHPEFNFLALIETINKFPRIDLFEIGGFKLLAKKLVINFLFAAAIALVVFKASMG